VTGEFRAGDIRHCVADVTRARRVLGFDARVGFDEGARELCAWAVGERPEDRTDQANAELRARGILR